MATGTMQTPGARIMRFNVQSGHKVVITLSGATNVYSLLITTAGSRDYNTVYHVAGYGASSSSCYIETIVAGSAISLNKSNGKVEIVASGSNGYRVTITALYEDPGGVSAALVSTS